MGELQSRIPMPPPIEPEEVRPYPRWFPRLVALVAVLFVLRLLVNHKGTGGSAVESALMYLERTRSMTAPVPRYKANPDLLAQFPVKATGWAGSPIALFADGTPVHRWNVLLNTGGFVHTQTDFYLPDVIPINLTRSYCSHDPESRNFGIGTSSVYEMYLVGDNKLFTYIDLNLADGTVVYFKRVSPGTGFDAVYEHAALPGDSADLFDHARLWWNQNWYYLKLKDGTQVIFSASRWAKYWGQRAMISISNASGDTMEIQRDMDGNMVAIASPNGRRLTFTHDGHRRITSADDGHGHRIRYQYDSAGRLSVVTDSAQGITRYGYDAANNMITIQRPDGRIWLANHYDDHNRVIEQTHLDGGTSHYRYVTGPNFLLSATEVTRPDGSIDCYRFDSAGSPISDSRP